MTANQLIKRLQKLSTTDRKLPVLYERDLHPMTRIKVRTITGINVGTGKESTERIVHITAF